MDEVGNWIAFGLLTVVLVVAAVTDVKTGKVFNWLTLPAIGVGLVLAALRGAMTAGEPSAWGATQAALIATLAALLGFGLLVILTGGLGFGDVKLMGAVGALTASWQCVASTAIYAFVVAVGIAIVVMIRGGLVKRTMHRLLSVLLTRASRTDVNLPNDSPKIPFAVAIAVGGVVAGAEVLLGVDTPWAANW